MMTRRREDEVNYGASSSSAVWNISDQNGSESEAQIRLGNQQSETLPYEYTRTTSYNTFWASGRPRTSSIDARWGYIPTVNSELNPANSFRYNTTPTDGKVVVSPPVTYEESLKFFYQIKYKFMKKPEKMSNFLNIIREYSSKSIGSIEAIQRMSNLFQEHNELIHGLNKLLPLGHKIEIQSNDQGISVPAISRPPLPRGSTSRLSLTIPAHTVWHLIPANTAPANNASGSTEPNVHNILLTSQQQSAAPPIVLPTIPGGQFWESPLPISIPQPLANNAIFSQASNHYYTNDVDTLDIASRSNGRGFEANGFHPGIWKN